LRLALAGENFSAYVAKRGLHRVRLAAGRWSIRAGCTITTALLALARAAGVALPLAASIALARPARARAGTACARAATGAPSAVLAHGGRLQIIGFRRFAVLLAHGLLVHGLLRHRRARVGRPGGAVLPARPAAGLVSPATPVARVAWPCVLPLPRLTLIGAPVRTD
jgi:hypothetical protein